MTRKFLPLTASFALLGTAAVAGADCTVDRAAYDALDFDMTYAQVAEVFGCEAEVSARAEITGGQATVYEWTDATTGTSVTTVFKDGELRSMMAPT